MFWVLKKTHWDGSSEHPQLMFWLRNEKIIILLHTLLKACFQMPFNLIKDCKKNQQTKNVTNYQAVKEVKLCQCQVHFIAYPF